MRRRTALLLSSAVALSCPSAGWAGRKGEPIISDLQLAAMRINVDAEDIEPINGFVPQVVMGLTNEQDSDDEYSGVEGFGIQSSSPGGSALPLTTGAAPLYVIATLDSGSAADIISYDAVQGFDLADAGLESSKTTEVEGASGTEDLTNTNALGVYATDFSQASVNGSGSLTVSPSSLQGQYNVPGLEGNQGDGLPNTLGSPILSQYRVTIQNSQPQHLTVGGVTSQTPKVTLGAFSSTVPAGYSKLTLKAYDSLAGGPETEPAPYYLNFDLTGPTNPDTPGAWAALLTNGGVGLARNGTSSSNQTFLLDTGAQVSVISNDTAASVGIYNASPANADFTVEVQGVGGITQVPGYFLNTLTLATQGGVMTWNRVPVIVLDVADPRDPTQAVPGILGTNLFSDRDLILNTNVSQTAQTYLAIGPQIMWQNSGGGSWSNSSNWAVVLPNGVDMQANFYGAITSAATINVDTAVTVGRITFDSANSYTLSGTNSITLDDSTDAAQINVRSGSHTIATPLSLASDTTVTVIPTTSTLTVSGPISSTGGAHGITLDGFGTLLLSGASSYTGPTDVISGTLAVTGSIASTSVTVDATNEPANLVLGGANALAPTAQLIGLGTASFAPTITVNASQSFASLVSTGTTTFTGGTSTVGPIDGTGTLSVTGASLTATHIRQNSLSVGPASTVTIADSATGPGNTAATSVLNDLYNSGTLDLKNNDLIVNDSTQFSAVRAAITDSYNGGAWNQPGITSSSAAANPSAYGLAYATASAIGTTTFDGQAVASGATLVKYTLLGDALLSGTVGLAGFNTVIANLNTGTLWTQGAFHPGSPTGLADYNAVIANFNQTASGSVAGLAVKSAIHAEAIAAPTAASDLTLEVNAASGDVYALAAAATALTGYDIYDKSANFLDSGDPNTDLNERLLSQPSTTTTGNQTQYRNATNYKLWVTILDNTSTLAEGQNNGKLKQGTASTYDTINIPSGGTIDFGDIYSTAANKQDLTFSFSEADATNGGNPVTGSTYNGVVSYVGVPEPTALGVLGLGGLMMTRRRRKSS